MGHTGIFIKPASSKLAFQKYWKIEPAEEVHIGSTFSVMFWYNTRYPGTAFTIPQNQGLKTRQIQDHNCFLTELLK